MKICHLTTIHAPLDARIFHKECRSLAAAGHDVHLLVPAPPDDRRDGVAFHDFDRPADGLRPVRVARRLWAIWRAARRLEADVYQFHDTELIVVGLLLKAEGRRVVYDVHEDAPSEALALLQDRPVEAQLRSWLIRALESAARAALDGFACATPAIAANFPDDRTVLLRNYPILDAPPAADGARVPGRVLYAGTLTALRGLPQLCDAVERLPAALGAELHILGAGADAALAAKIDGCSRAVSHGFVGRETVLQHMAEAQVGCVLLQPTPIYLESLPVKMFEYMAAGLPVVASDFPLWREIVEASGCGVCVDPTDPDAIAAALGALLADPGRAAAMGARGRERALAEYNWDAESRALLALYDRLAAR